MNVFIDPELDSTGRKVVKFLLVASVVVAVLAISVSVLGILGIL